MHSALRLPAMYKVKPNVKMKCLVPRIVDDLRNQHATLCFRPAEDFADETQSIRLDAHAHVFALISADFLHGGVFCPRTDWDLGIVSQQANLTPPLNEIAANVP
jgi:hypothetical protein